MQAQSCIRYLSHPVAVHPARPVPRFHHPTVTKTSLPPDLPRGAEELEKDIRIHAVLPVVARRLALTVLVLLGEIFLDEVFEAGFAEVGGHTDYWEGAII